MFVARGKSSGTDKPGSVLTRLAPSSSGSGGRITLSTRPTLDPSSFSLLLGGRLICNKRDQLGSGIGSKVTE